MTRQVAARIDRVVSRTVSYVASTAILVGVYAVGVVGAGRFVRVFLGEVSNDLLVAASTLAVAAAFGPVRRQVQALVDRRFNRARYDAALTVDSFAQRLRDELDPRMLAAEGSPVAGRTSQPTHVSLWLVEVGR